ncbi:delta-60 repeat domain-containing protein [Pseudomonas mediterranea]|uniref:delta-60 repeat domain-containing protein n=1 Tax=Pseudomonas mediterranea TaxID=183795 RepID=UPI003BF5955F
MDETFNGGTSIVELPGVEYSWITASGVAVQSDRKVLVCGHYGAEIQYGVFVVRFDSEGRVDPDFNNNRPVVIPLARTTILYSIAIGKSQGVEKILVVGMSAESDGSKGLMVVLNEQGLYDSTFNNGTPLFATLYARNLTWSKCDWRPDGRIVVTGAAGHLDTSRNGVLTARYRSDGILDPLFNDGVGYVVYEGTNGANVPEDMVVMADERIVVSGLRLLGGSIVDNWILRYLA